MIDAKIGGIPGAAITIFVSVASAVVGAIALIVHSAAEIATLSSTLACSTSFPPRSFVTPFKTIDHPAPYQYNAPPSGSQPLGHLAISRCARLQVKTLCPRRDAERRHNLPRAGPLFFGIT